MDLPNDLREELLRMRQVPEEFTPTPATCGWCPVKGQAVALGHEKVKEAGTWCPVHGWRYFQSPQLPPKEK